MRIPGHIKRAGIPDPITSSSLAGQYVDVYLDGVCNKTHKWTEVNVAGGWGRRYLYDDNGRHVIEDRDIATEVVEGQFEVKWRE